MTKRWVLVLLMVLGVAVPATASTPAAPTLTVLSNTRADLVSDGQALVGLSTSTTDGLRVTVGSRDVTKAFARRASGRVEGIVDGLRVGANVVTASVGSSRQHLTITNHPNGGPLFTGPQLQPWNCPSGSLDKQCDAKPRFTYLYLSTNPQKAGLQPYSGDTPPTDVATTTTDQGVKVPFIVRQELGYQDRDQYKVLTLIDPRARSWNRWSPPKTWNHKVLVTGGGGCGGSYGTGNAPLADFSGTIPAIPGRNDSYVDALGLGYTVMTTALDNTGHNCNVAVEAEALIMLKERVIEQYGDIRYTIGTGCSGGSIVQHTIANAYPGAVYDGLIVTCAYPDTFTAGSQFADYHMLRTYFENPSAWGTGVVWTPSQWAAVEGRPDPVNAIVADEGLFKDAVNPSSGCVDPKKQYSSTNPGGVRCSILDYMKTLLGTRPRSVWTAPEKKAGKSFAGQPFSNVGIQYGLSALQQGLITPEMFVDLNEKIGGLDIDAKASPKRMVGDDSAVANSYRTGLVDEADNLDTVPIIDHAGPDPGAAHDYAHTWWVRDRIDKAHGQHGNQVLWFGPTPLIGDPSWPTAALRSMDSWLAAVTADHSGASLARRIVRDRPAGVHDRCAYAVEVQSAPTDGVCLPQTLQTHYGTPREVAGGPATNDVLKCVLKPLSTKDYGLLGLTAAQLTRLRSVFPAGVCDWARKGVGQQAVVPWQTYQDATGHVVYGGHRMPAAPRSTP